MRPCSLQWRHHTVQMPPHNRVGASSNPLGTNASHLYLVMAPTDYTWSWVGSGRVGLSGQKSWPAPDPSHVWVEFRVFSYNFRVERVGLGYFLSSGEIFDPRPTCRTVGSGFFSSGSGWIYRVGQLMIRYKTGINIRLAHLYRSEPPPGINVSHICTRWNATPVQMSFHPRAISPPVT
jgi:hypothetical protein